MVIKIFPQTVCWSLFFFLTISGPLRAQEKSPKDPEKSCRDFVQGFYSWYVRQNTSFDYAIRQRRSAFSHELFRLLKEDAEASAKVSGEIVGLDFDPILASQDPGNRYVVGTVTRKGDRYWVEVYGVWAGKKSSKPNVMPEVMLKDGHWLFVNFHYENDPRYPMNENLLSVLKGLRESRQKNK